MQSAVCSQTGIMGKLSKQHAQQPDTDIKHLGWKVSCFFLHKKSIFYKSLEHSKSYDRNAGQLFQQMLNVHLCAVKECFSQDQNSWVWSWSFLDTNY